MDFKSRHFREPDLKPNQINEKGETALHQACKRGALKDITEKLKSTTDINAPNYWGQTALHYAAEAQSTETLKLLLRTPGIQATCKDVNGYTVLQTFVVSSQKFDYNWIDGVQLLVEAGIDINSQTNYGQTVLHLASYQDDNTDFLQHLLSKYHGLKLTVTNSFGENFLHIYSMREIGEKCMSVFDSIRMISKQVLREMLNQKDMNGYTPWVLMFENGELTSNNFNTITNIYGVSPDTADNLGNTALMIRVGCSASSMAANLQIYRNFICKGVDVNCQNVFGLSSAALLYNDEVYQVLSKKSLDLMLKDRWDRLPVVSVMNQRVLPELLEAMLQDNGNMINSRDRMGSTLLHFASYLGIEDYIDILLRYGADLEARDALGDTPLETARRHGNSKCFKLLAEAKHLTSTEDSWFIYTAPKTTVDLSLLLTAPVKTVLNGFPEHLDTFLGVKYKRNSEVSDIIEAVNKQVRNLCEIISGYDSRFSISVLYTGSTAEGTKVGAPDEFDFALCLDNLNDMCDIQSPMDPKQFGFARLQFKDNPVPEEYISFSDMERYFLPLPFLHYLFRYVRRALNERKLWESGNLYTRTEDKIYVITDKPVLNYHVYWNGAYYKQVHISIDLVPAVYRRGWWPHYARFENKMLITDEVKAAGCLILMQTEANTFGQEWYNMNDSITYTCKASSEVDKERLLQVSVAPAEIALMKSLPEIYRTGYALAKIMKSEEVCPKVKIDIKLPPNTWRQYVSGSRAFVNPSHDIKSYWLKNCLFYIVDENSRCPLQDEAPLEIAKMIYKKLQEFATRWNFKPYVLEKADLFEFEDEKYGFNVFITRRKISIDTVLALLGQPFSNDISEWIITCTQNFILTQRNQ